MLTFHYVALNANGKEQKGVIEAENEKHARQLLRDKSLFPLFLQSQQQNKTTDKEKRSRLFSLIKARGLTSKELALITRQFATLLSAGLPIEEALAAVTEQSDKPRIKGLVLSVRSKVVEGHALAAALREHPEAFSALFCSTIAAGEKTGHLDKVLTRLADYTEQQWQIRQKLKNALIYPMMIVLVAIGIVGFLLEYVVPKMVSVYGHMKQALPFLTTVLISISGFIKAYGFYFMILLAMSLYTAWMMLKKNASFREKTHAVLLRIPLFGYAFRTADTARFARTLSILTASGVPVLEAMTISAELISSIPIRKAIEAAVHRVREGITIHLALKQTQYFSPMSIHMIASGEASGQLEGMLDRVARHNEDDIVQLIEVALALFEPAIILIMGGIVLFIVLAVLMPIFNLNDFSG